MNIQRRAVLAGLASSSLVGFKGVTARAQSVDVTTSLPFSGYIRTNWSKDPFSYGAYSYIAKDSNITDLATLGAPIGESVYFAGEAVSPDYQSTVHAAYESGLSAAQAAIADRRKSVGVIGAGAAGLAAARALRQAGVAVVVFEGRDRIGGRIWTDRSLGPALELGAAFIVGENGNPVTALADSVNASRVGFGIEDSEGDVVLNRDGQELWGLFQPSWLEELLFNNMMGTDHTNLNMEHFEKKSESYFGKYTGGNVVIPGGYDQILAPLQAGYDVQLNAIVNHISHNQAGAEIGLSEGASHRFDAVIVTVPLGVLKEETITFDPVLSADNRVRVCQGVAARAGLQAIGRHGNGSERSSSAIEFPNRTAARASSSNGRASMVLDLGELDVGVIAVALDELSRYPSRMTGASTRQWPRSSRFFSGEQSPVRAF